MKTGAGVAARVECTVLQARTLGSKCHLPQLPYAIHLKTRPKSQTEFGGCCATCGIEGVAGSMLGAGVQGLNTVVRVRVPRLERVFNELAFISVCLQFVLAVNCGGDATYSELFAL